jgi:hypothetical protein
VTGRIRLRERPAPERLQKSRAARCFLDKGFAAENAEVTVRRRPR